MKKDLKGITLIELLAVIIILSIILTIAGINIINLIARTRTEVYVRNEEILEGIARKYVISNPHLLPITIGNKTQITLQELQDNDYITEMKNPSNQSESCNGHVEVEKTADNLYLYNAYIKCGNDYETVVGNWSEWSLDEPIGDNLEVESSIFYNYRTGITYYSNWSSWIDVVASNNDGLRIISEVIGNETENRTVYSYYDQQWRWYDDASEIQCASSMPTGTGWSQGSACGWTIETQCASTMPSGTGWSQGSACEYGTQTQCASATPSGTGWSQGSGCSTTTETSSCVSSSPGTGWTFSHYGNCLPGETASGAYCLYTYLRSSTYTYTCQGGTWVTTNCSGTCNAPCYPSCVAAGTNTETTNCTPTCVNGTTCTRTYSGSYCDCAFARCQYYTRQTTTSWNYSRSVINQWNYSRSVVNEWNYSRSVASKWTYSRQVANQWNYTRGTINYASGYHSTAPLGYPNKDISQFQYTTQTLWSEITPTSYTYRTINSKQQYRTRDIISDWSGNVLSEYVTEDEFVNMTTQTLAQIQADSNKMLISIVKYRYRIRSV